MDTSVYSNYALARATLRFVMRVREQNPALWEQIKAETLAALQDSQADYTDGDMQQLCEGVV